MKSLLDSIEELDWAPEHISDSLGAVYRHATGRGEEAIHWYFRAKSSVSHVAGILRLCAVLSISIGAVGPLISSVWSLDLLPFSSPLSPTLFAAMAATFIGIDRALGFSSRQMRFDSAVFGIQKLLEGFRFKWYEKMADLRGKPATAEEIRSMLQMATAFEESVWNIVQSERAEGRADYEKSLATIQAQADKMTSKGKDGRPG